MIDVYILHVYNIRTDEDLHCWNM